MHDSVSLPADLLMRMGLNDDEITTRKEWLQFSDADEKRLVELHALAKGYADEIIDSLYDHFLHFDDTKKFFEDINVLNRVKKLQKEYFLRLTEGNYNNNYIEGRLKIGIAHAAVGLDIKWYLGAYHFYIRAIGERIFESFKNDTKKAWAIFSSLSKLIYLDMGIAIETYIFQREQTISNQEEVIRERVARETQLNKSLEEKEVLLKEVYHRVKNNLQVISSLFNLQIDTTKNKAVRNILHDSMARIKSMTLVHELLYQSNDLSMIDMKIYTNDLLQYLMELYQVDPLKIKLMSEIDAVSLTLDSAINCGLIINELITNAVKHAFSSQQSGVIKISLKNNGEMILLRVSDDGQGMPENMNIQSQSSLGMQLIYSLSKQLQGSVTLKNDHGSMVTITFKK